MTAYHGVVKDKVIVLSQGVQLEEGTQVEVTPLLQLDVSAGAPEARNGAAGYSSSFFDPPRSLEELAAEQGVSPVTDFDTLLGDFWPDDEPVEEFIAALGQWRQTDSYRTCLDATLRR